MSSVMIVFAIVAAVLVAGYLLVMRVFYKEGQELDKKIDYSKVRKWTDDD